MSKSNWLCIGIVISGVLLLACAMDGRKITVEAEGLDISDPISSSYDPNNSIYAIVWPMTPQWIKTHGESERSRILSNLSALNRIVVELVKLSNKQGARIKVLEEWQKSDIESVPIGGETVIILADPNEVEE